MRSLVAPRLAPDSQPVGVFSLSRYDLAMVQTLASVVPEGLQEVFSRRLACLPRSYVIVLKVTY